MKPRLKKLSSALLAMGLGLGLVTTAVADQSLKEVMEARGLTEKDLEELLDRSDMEALKALSSEFRKPEDRAEDAADDDQDNGKLIELLEDPAWPEQGELARRLAPCSPSVPAARSRSGPTRRRRESSLHSRKACTPKGTRRWR